jgi:DNA-binding transcriptional regulator YhcF (GntR family)
MNRLLDPPAIKQIVQVMACTVCGTEVNAGCTCGANYVPKSIRAAEAVKADPGKSDRAIAEKIGVDHKTVAKVRADLEDVGSIPHVDTRTDSKGRQQPATKPQARHEDLLVQAHTAMDEVIAVMRQMTLQQRSSFREAAKERMAEANLDVVYF